MYIAVPYVKSSAFHWFRISISYTLWIILRFDARDIKYDISDNITIMLD